MQPRRTALLSVLALTAALSACSTDDRRRVDAKREPGPRDALNIEATQPKVTATRPQRDAFAKASNALGFDLMKQVGAAPGNYVLSPASISMALSMAFAGAKTETAAQMRTALHLEGSLEDIAAGAGGTIQALEELPAPTTIRVANRLFGEQSSKFEAPFLALTREGFGAALVPVNFIGDPDAARLAINDWASYETEQRVTGLLPEGSVTPDTRLVLANAIYFLGTWATPFPERRTDDRPFTKSGGATADVKTMHLSERVRHVSKDGLSAIALAYEGAPLSMLLLLPDAPDGLPALEASLDAAKVEAVVGALSPKEVVMSIPRFELAPETSLSLTKILSALGMPLAFDGASADFSGMSTTARLKISDVFHKAFIKVSEKGTEAAAATGVVMAASASPAATPPLRFVADHPFLFLVRDDVTGAILFAGRVADPGH